MTAPGGNLPERKDLGIYASVAIGMKNLAKYPQGESNPCMQTENLPS